MKVDNKTRFDTRKLRSVILAVYRSTGKELLWWKRVVILVKYGRRRYGTFDRQPDDINGRAVISGYTMWIYVPRERLDVVAFAQLFHHELLHLFGIKDHRDYPAHLSRNYNEATESYRWVLTECNLARIIDELPPPPPKPKPTKREKQQAKVDALLKRRKGWLTKARRAATALKQIDRSLRYYERQGLDVGELEPVEKPKKKRRRKKARQR